MKIKFLPPRILEEDAKRKFLAAFDMRYPAAATAPWLVVTARALGAALALAAIVVSGATAYADAANVPADSPLYPFKRLGESVQLAVAPPQADASLEATFAARRVAEIADLQSREPTSTMIVKLSDDADEAVNAAIAAADKAGLQDGQLTKLCTRLLGTLVSSSTTMQGELHGNLNALDRFTQQCEQAGNNNNAGSTVNHPFVPARFRTSVPLAPTTTTITSGTSGEMPSGEMSPGAELNPAAPSGTEPSVELPMEPPNVPELETRIHNYLDNHAAASSSLDLASTSVDAAQSAILELQGQGQGQGQGQIQGKD